METPIVEQNAESAKVTAEAPKPAVEDLAARDYQTLLPEYHALADSVYFSQLRRVFNAIVEYPFADSSPRLNDSTERELFSVVSQLMDCKFVMMKTFLSMKQDEIKAMLKEETPDQKGDSNV